MALTRRTPAQTSKREAIERSVLETTDRLLKSGESYADLSVERISAEAGLSRTAFYFYFRDKRELLTRLTADVGEQLYTVADGWWSGEGDPTEELERALDQIFDIYAESATLFRAVVESAAYDEPIAEQWRTLMERYVDATTHRIESEQKAGRVDTRVPAAPTAFALVWMVERACYQHLVSGGDLRDVGFLAALKAIWKRALYGRVD